MIIGTVTVTRAMVLAAFAAVSFLIAFAGLFLSLGLGLPTPGFWRWRFLFPGATTSLPSLQPSLCRSQLTGCFGLR